MQNTEWIRLFKQVPAEFHNQIVFVLNNRTEIAMETLFRVEATHLLLRGRLGGTTEGGLLFVVPFDEIATVYINREVKEGEVDQIFGPVKNQSRLISPSRQAVKTVVVDPAAAPAAPPNAAPAAAAAAMPAFGRPPEATSVARNNLLERLRAARQAAGPQTNGSK
jgi:hypothetical protein